jgi:hypothetical protein
MVVMASGRQSDSKAQRETQPIVYTDVSRQNTFDNGLRLLGDLLGEICLAARNMSQITEVALDAISTLKSLKQQSTSSAPTLRPVRLHGTSILVPCDVVECTECPAAHCPKRFGEN